LEEEDVLRSSTLELFVCARCFDDYAIEEFIKAHAVKKQCSFCGRRNLRKAIAAPGEDVLEFFLRGIGSEFDDVGRHSLPFDQEEGKYIVPVYGIWDLVHDQFADISSSDRILDWIVESFNDGRQWCDRNPLILSPEEGLVAGWKDFCAAVKHKTRYLFFETPPQQASGELPEPGEEPHYVHPAKLLEEIGADVKSAGLIREIPAGTSIFRARPHGRGICYTTPADLGPPLEDRAKAGRMNAAGIVVFYAALDEITALAETAHRAPCASIGTFVLTRPARVLDLRNLPPVPSIFDESKIDLRLPLRFLHSFRIDISEAVVPDERVHVEYAPTQVVSEFIKLRFTDQEGNRVDGVLYPSSRRREGCNAVLFANRDNVEGIPSDGYAQPEKWLLLTASKTVLVEDGIRLRAYWHYVQQGRTDGFALRNWLEAEAEILGIDGKQIED
jgi:RES domain-containing protein